MTLAAEASPEAPWYADWQHGEHAVHFDGRARLSDVNLIRSLEAFNDVRLLKARVPRTAAATLVEVGCATGEMSRYCRLHSPSLRYVGLDISASALARARTKYPHGQFLLSKLDQPLLEQLRGEGIGIPELLYAKDVVHHQTRPFVFLEELITSATQAIIMRLRTRDVGTTVLDPEQSCQYHYGGWMPYIVMNLDEVVERIRQAQPRSEIAVWRHRMILGGRLNRFLPKACYLAETGTAETAVGVFLDTDQPGRVTIEDRVDGAPRYTLDYRLARLAARVWTRLTGGNA